MFRALENIFLTRATQSMINSPIHKMLPETINLPQFEPVRLQNDEPSDGRKETYKQKGFSHSVWTSEGCKRTHEILILMIYHHEYWHQMKSVQKWIFKVCSPNSWSNIICTQNVSCKTDWNNFFLSFQLWASGISLLLNFLLINCVVYCSCVKVSKVEVA